GPPRVSIVAGIDGDEVTGVHAVNLVAGVLAVRRPSGSVYLLPCVNMPGAETGEKTFLGEELDAAFHGDPGSPAGRVAAAVLDATQGDLCIEVQTGNRVTDECPHVRAPLYGHALEAARASGLPVLWKRAGKHFDGGLMGAWRAEARPGLTLRGGQAGLLSSDAARKLARAMVRILTSRGLLPPDPDAGGVLLETDQVDEYRANFAGFFAPEVGAGERVRAGGVLGVVRAPIGGSTVEEVRIKRPGIVLSTRVYPLVNARELLVRIAVG
ncbi:MAG: hypothetical protein EXR69_11170, partial [Myxococcales bacterium]|nr:hypothetical protein [Myxococcales bacterium]